MIFKNDGENIDQINIKNLSFNNSFLSKSFEKDVQSKTFDKNSKHLKEDLIENDHYLQVDKFKYVKTSKNKIRKLYLRKKIKCDITHLIDCKSNIHNFLCSQKNILNKINSTPTDDFKLTNQSKKSTQKTNQLWIDKYKPKSFINMCSAGNDNNFRYILHWLKKWANYINFKNQKKNEDTQLNERPNKKILFIYGPPGIGKTLCTEIFVKQMGFNIEEINTSNSMGTTFSMGYTKNNYLKFKIINALTSNSILSLSKPSCIVIDEIDSLMNSNEVIRLLHDFIISDQKISSNKWKINQNKKLKGTQLTRPIICIANSIYNYESNNNNFSLDLIKPYCEILMMKKLIFSNGFVGTVKSSNAIKPVRDYIISICKKENLNYTNQDIDNILEMHDGDIRATIIYLQFNRFKQKKNHQNDKLNIFVKNELTNLNWVSFLNFLFKRDLSLNLETQLSILYDRFVNSNCKNILNNKILFEKILSGSFNKCLNVVYHKNDNLKNLSIFNDWLMYYEIISKEKIHESNSYFFIIGLKIWLLFNDPSPIKPDFSVIPEMRVIQNQFKDTLKQNKVLLREIVEKMRIKNYKWFGLNHEFYSCYFLPFLDKTMILNSNKIKSNQSFDKNTISKVSKIFIFLDFKLNFKQDFRDLEKSYYFVPNWESITDYNKVCLKIFQEEFNTPLKTKPKVVYKLLATEIDILESENKKAKRQNESHLNSEKSKKIKNTNEMNSFNFIKKKFSFSSKKLDDLENHKKKEIVWVKYNEGYSNAVKKNIGWFDFWI